MKKIDLTYLNIPRDNQLIEILRSYGEQIASGTLNMVSYIITDTREEDEIKSASFYLVVPELNKQHQLLTLDILDVENIKIKLWALTTNKHEDYSVKYSPSNYTALEDIIGDILNNRLVRAILTFFIDNINLKRSISKTWINDV